MKTMMIAGSLALALATATFAQTTGTVYGTAWSESAAATFLTKDGETAKMRNQDEIAANWKALTQAERDTVIADCTAYRAAALAQGQEAATDVAAAGVTAEVAANIGLPGLNMAQACEVVAGG